MNNVPLLIHLRDALDAQSIPWVVRALRQDAAVWQALQDLDFCKRVISRASSELMDWSPGQLALLALGGDLSLSSLREVPLRPLDVEVSKKALQALEQLLIPETPPEMTLERAGWIALALRERYRLHNSWDDPFAVLEPFLPGNFQTPMACLYAMVPQPFDLLTHLLPWPELLLHTLFSNPLPPQERDSLLEKIASSLEADQSISFLFHLRRYAPSTSESLARKQITTLEQNPDGLETFYRRMSLFELAKRPSQALTRLQAALIDLQKRQAEFQAQRAMEALAQGDSESCLEAWEQAIRLDPNAEGFRAAHILALLECGQSERAESLLEDYLSTDAPDRADVFLAAALLFQRKGEMAQGRNYGEKALALLENPPSPYIATKYITEWTGLLLEWGLKSEAVQAAQIVAQRSPNEAAAHHLLSRAQFAAGQLDAATANAQLATSLDPSNLDYQRHLAALLEACEDWPSALHERKRIVQAGSQTSSQQLLADLHQWAECALRADSPEQAAQACERALKISPEDGMTHILLGKALLAQGEKQKAQDHFEKAMYLAPEHAAPWLALAQMYQESGDTKTALDTLRAAVNAVPDNPLIFLELGKIHLSQDSPTLALNALRKAHSLDTSSLTPAQIMEMHRFLAEALFRLGHLDEAYQHLHPVYEQNPDNLDLAQLYAQILLTQEKPEQAIPALKKVIEGKPDHPQPYLDLGKSLLKTQNQAGEAILYLRKAMELTEKYSPEYQLGQALLAEAHLNNGEYQEALSHFRGAMESSLGSDPFWKTRLSLGLARAALHLGDHEVAIAAMVEAAELDSQNPEIFRLLTEAYQKAGLTQNALEAAETARNLASDDPDTLLWFADFALRHAPALKSSPLPKSRSSAQLLKNKAIQALREAAEIAPERLPLLATLAEAQLQHGGDPLAAWRTYYRLLELAANAPPTAENIVHLQDAAQAFLRLNDPLNAVACLEKALEFNQKSGDSAQEAELRLQMVQAKRAAGDLHGALKSLNALMAEHEAHLDVPSLLLKSEILSELNQPTEAVACLQEALKRFPDSPDLHQFAARLLRQMGDLPAALEHAEKQVASLRKQDQPHQPDHAIKLVKAVTQAAELARFSLQPERARNLLDEPLDLPEETDQPEFYPYFILRAELALEAGEEIKTAQGLTQALAQDENHLRTRALQARLLLRQGDFSSAQKTLNECFHQLSGNRFLSSSASAQGEQEQPCLDAAVYLAVVTAALEAGYWNQAVKLAQQAVRLAPREPLPHLQLAQVIVIRAEAQKLCQELEARHHAPGREALSEEAYHLFLEAIESASRCQLPQPHPPQIQSLLLRGKALFQNETGLHSRLPQLSLTPEEVAGRIALLRYLDMGEQALQTARHYPAHPLVLTQLLLTLLPRNRREALSIARSLERGAFVGAQTALIPPLFYRLLAGLAHHNQHNKEALGAMEKALHYWPEEDRWHAFAARLRLESADGEDLSRALEHLEQAIRLEPDHIPHYLEMARAYLNHEIPEKAARVLQQATQKAPDQPEAWYSLAQVHFASGELKRAAACADRALELGPDQVAPLLLRARIALKAGDHNQAFSLAQSAFEHAPQNAEAALLLSQILEAMGKPHQALQSLETTIPNVEQPLPLLLEQVRLQRATQGDKAALKTLKKVAQAYPNEPSVLLPLAEAMERSGEADIALKAAKRALQYGKTRLSLSEKARLQFLLGRLSRATGQLDKAIEHLNEATRLEPQMVDAYLELGRTYHERREASAALKSFQQAIDLNPNDPRPYQLAGLTFQESKDYRNAEAMLRYAAELAPNDVKIRRQLGAIMALHIAHSV